MTAIQWVLSIVQAYMFTTSANGQINKIAINARFYFDGNFYLTSLNR